MRPLIGFQMSKVEFQTFFSDPPPPYFPVFYDASPYALCARIFTKLFLIGLYYLMNLTLFPTAGVGGFQPQNNIANYGIFFSLQICYFII